MGERFGVVIADPPWDYRNGGNGYAGNHYPLMSVDEICDLPVADFAADNAILLLWATWPQVAGAVRVVDSWGFEYITGFPWVRLYEPPLVDMFGELRARPVYGTGAWVRGCSEPILVARRGKVPPPDNPHFMGLISERFEHSRKPDNLYQYAEQFDGPYLELFARRPRPGWATWGNTLDADVPLAVPAENVPEYGPVIRPDPADRVWPEGSLFYTQEIQQ